MIWYIKFNYDKAGIITVIELDSAISLIEFTESLVKYIYQQIFYVNSNHVNKYLLIILMYYLNKKIKFFREKIYI